MGPIHFSGGAHCIKSRIYDCEVCALHNLYPFVHSLVLDIMVEESFFHFSCSGNHERTWPNSGSFYNHMDSGGECGVLAETMFYVPAENRAKFW